MRRERKNDSDLKAWEVYGFVGLALSLISAVLYVVWLAVPDETLEAWGVAWYPRKYWGLSLPGIILFVGIYPFVYNMTEMWMNTPPLDSMYFIEDEFQRPTCVLHMGPTPRATVPAAMDLDLGAVNRCLYDPAPD